MKKIVFIVVALFIANTALAFSFKLRPSRINSKYSFNRSGLSTVKQGALGSGKDLLFFITEDTIKRAVKKTIESVDNIEGKNEHLNFISTKFCTNCAKDGADNILNAIETTFSYSKFDSIIIMTQAVIQTDDDGNLQIQIVPGVKEVRDLDGDTYFYHKVDNMYYSFDNMMNADEIRTLLGGSLPIPTDLMNKMISFNGVKLNII